MTVYLLHFLQPLGDPDNPRGQAQHYLGSADDVAGRLASHRFGHGAAIMRACAERGIDWALVRTHVARRPNGRARAEALAQGGAILPHLPRRGVPMNAQTPTERFDAFLLVGIHEAGETPHAGGPGEQFGLFDGATSDLGGAVWLAFTGDHDEADAARRFEAKYGQPPARVFDGLGGLLLCGPIPSRTVEAIPSEVRS